MTRVGTRPLEGAQTHTLRLQQLYEVSTLLTRFDEDALPRVAALLAEALPLRSVIMVLEDRSGAHRAKILWPAEPADSAASGPAIARAEKSYAYLAGEAATPPGSPEGAAADQEFLALPLVVQHSPMFGVLQLETPAPCAEEDLLFANTVVNQLAVALDRQLRIEARHAAAEAEADRAEERRDEAVGARRRYEALVDHLDHAFVWEADAETRQVFYVSARAEMLLGYPRERWADEPDFWNVCVHAEDREMLLGAFETAVVTGKDQRCNHRSMTADGGVVWLHTGVHLAHDDPDAPALQGVSVDITPAKDAENAIREQLDFSRAITHDLGEGVVAVDLRGHVTFLNPAAAKLLALRQEETVGTDIHRVFQLQHSAGVPIREGNHPALVAMRTGEALNSEDYVVVHRRGGDVPISCTAAPLWREDRVSGAVLVFQDITERKRMDEAQREADRRKNEFLAMLGHELRNPLAPIASAAHVLRVGDTASQQRAGDIIERQVDRMGRMIDELLDIARIATGRIELHRRRVDLRSVVESAVETVRPFINRRGHELEIILVPEPLWVHADVDRIEQVAANLLDNAAKYTPPGGRLTAIAERDGEDVVLRVRDNGPGITAELLSRIFELFSQGERPADRSQGGLGIGLALVKQIVEMHGGTVKAETLPGGGSEFTVRLALADHEPESKAGGVAERAAQSAGQLRILVVDDNVDTAESLAMLLRGLKHEVQTAYDGPTAMEAAVDFRPHTVLLDIGLPGIDGYETARRMRKHPELRHCVLVALTGYGQEMDRQRSREAGFDHHLTKPATFSDLQNILNAQ